MATISVDIEEIPHGHGLSFKRGVSDGLLDSNEHDHEVHETNKASYRRGIEAGKKLKEDIAKLVKK
jgi:hypothetical protein